MTDHHFFSEHPFCAAGPLGVLPLACTWPSACHCSAEAPEASRESAVARAHPGSPWASLLARTPCHPTEPLLLLNCPRLIRLSKLRTPGGREGASGWLLASGDGGGHAAAMAVGRRPSRGGLLRFPEAGSSCLATGG